HGYNRNEVTRNYSLFIIHYSLIVSRRNITFRFRESIPARLAFCTLRLTAVFLRNKKEQDDVIPLYDIDIQFGGVKVNSYITLTRIQSERSDP
ncbi:MAG: hypothetical protein IKV21_02095, partial [Clostridia bacterium]|nr:hypothetical protein [Clostridia bacterium]